MTTEFAVVIQYQLEGEKPKAIILDTVEDVQVNGSSTITTQPIVTGDEIADHMYKNPSTLHIKGNCSLNGSQMTVVDGEGSKLANFEDLFETIKKQGVRCNIFKISIRNDKDIRFLQRSNMVLESFTWTEKINSLAYSLNFKQVLVADVVEYDVDTDDEFLPNVTEPSTLSFTSTLIDWSKIDASICDILEKESLWTTGFKTFLSSMSKPTMASLITAGAAIVIGAVLAALNTTPVGWVLTAIGLAIAAVAIFVVGIANAIKKAKARRKYAIEKFDYYKNNDKKNAQELERFADFISGIHNEFEAINDAIHVYQISENQAQEAMISVGDEYYIFTFTKNNVDNKYSLNITNVDKTNNKEFADIEAAPTNFGDITSANYLIKAKNNSRIYLLCPSEDKKDLTNYFILVCDFNPDDFQKIVEDIIASHIYRNA